MKRWSLENHWIKAYLNHFLIFTWIKVYHIFIDILILFLYLIHYSLFIYSLFYILYYFYSLFIFYLRAMPNINSSKLRRLRQWKQLGTGITWFLNKCYFYRSQVPLRQKNIIRMNNEGSTETMNGKIITGLARIIFFIILVA